MINWQVYTFYPNPSPDVDSVFYMGFVKGFVLFKKVNQKSGETFYGFRADGLIWFTTERQIVKFLML